MKKVILSLIVLCLVSCKSTTKSEVSADTTSVKKAVDTVVVDSLKK